MRKVTAELEALRNLARYKYHGGYVFAAVTDDGELLCVPCLRKEYRQVFEATRDKIRNGWQVIGHANSGEHDIGDPPAHCVHCNKLLWDTEP